MRLPHPLVLLVLFWALLVGCNRPDQRALPAVPLVGAQTVYGIGHGWHVGIAVPREALAEQGGPELQDFPEAVYVEFGWGDADFYRAPEATIRLLWQAAFASQGSVVSVIALPVPPLEYYRRSEVIAIALPAEGLAALVQYIQRSYSRDAQGQVIRLGPGPYGRSAFYQAVGQYSLNYTCNTWAAEAFQAAGLTLTPTAQAGPLLRQLRAAGLVLRR